MERARRGDIYHANEPLRGELIEYIRIHSLFPVSEIARGFCLGVEDQGEASLAGDVFDGSGIFGHQWAEAARYRFLSRELDELRTTTDLDCNLAIRKDLAHALKKISNHALHLMKKARVFYTRGKESALAQFQGHRRPLFTRESGRNSSAGAEFFDGLLEEDWLGELHANYFAAVAGPNFGIGPLIGASTGLRE